MTDEEIREMHKVTSKYTREHMFNMVDKREPIIKQKLAEIEAEEIMQEDLLAQELKHLNKYGNLNNFEPNIPSTSTSVGGINYKQKEQENYVDLETKDINSSYNM